MDREGVEQSRAERRERALCNGVSRQQEAIEREEPILPTSAREAPSPSTASIYDLYVSEEYDATEHDNDIAHYMERPGSTQTFTRPDSSVTMTGHGFSGHMSQESYGPVGVANNIRSSQQPFSTSPFSLGSLPGQREGGALGYSRTYGAVDRLQNGQAFNQRLQQAQIYNDGGFASLSRVPEYDGYGKGQSHGYTSEDLLSYGSQNHPIHIAEDGFDLSQHVENDADQGVLFQNIENHSMGHSVLQQTYASNSRAGVTDGRSAVGFSRINDTYADPFILGVNSQNVHGGQPEMVIGEQPGFIDGSFVGTHLHRNRSIFTHGFQQAPEANRLTRPSWNTASSDQHYSGVQPSTTIYAPLRSKSRQIVTTGSFLGNHGSGSEIAPQEVGTYPVSALAGVYPVVQGRQVANPQGRPHMVSGPSGGHKLILSGTPGVQSQLDPVTPSISSVVNPPKNTNEARLKAEEVRRVKKNLAAAQYRAKLRQHSEQQQLDRVKKIECEDRAVMTARDNAHNRIAQWLNREGWRAKPWYANADLRSYLQGIFPGASVSTINKLSSSGSSLLRRILGPMRQMDTSPQLTIRQLLTVALIRRHDRTASQEKMVSWLEKIYPWFAQGQFEATDGEIVARKYRTTLRSHVQDFLQIMAGSYQPTFKCIDPRYPAHTEEACAWEEVVWHLPAGLDTSTLDETCANRGLPLVGSPAIPRELRLMVLEEYLRYPEIVHATTSNNHLHLYTECPESTATVRTHATAVRYGRDERYVFRLPRLEEILATPRAFWGSTAVDTFFRQNTIAISNCDLYLLQHEGRSFADGALTMIGLQGRLNLARVHISLVLEIDDKGIERNDINRAFKLLGEGRHLVEVTLDLELRGRALQAASRGDFLDIPGMSVFRRFRGIRLFTIAMDPLVPELEAWLRARVTQTRLKIGPQRALQDRPLAASTLARKPSEELEKTARLYGLDPDKRWLPGGKKLSKQQLGSCTRDQMQKCCSDPEWNTEPSGLRLVRMNDQSCTAVGAPLPILHGSAQVTNPPQTDPAARSLFGRDAPNAVSNDRTRTVRQSRDPNSVLIDRVGLLGQPNDGSAPNIIDASPAPSENKSLNAGTAMRSTVTRQNSDFPNARGDQVRFTGADYGTAVPRHSVRGQHDEVDSVHETDMDDNSARSIIAKRSEPPTDMAGNGGKRPKTK